MDTKSPALNREAEFLVHIRMVRKVNQLMKLELLECSDGFWMRMGRIISVIYSPT